MDPTGRPTSRCTCRRPRSLRSLAPAQVNGSVSRLMATPMEHESVAKIVLVRAVEEVLPTRIPPEVLLEVHLAAGDPAQGYPWIASRAAYLVEHHLGSYSTAFPRPETAAHAPLWLILLAALVGLASNYLGPSAKIHVLWNPILILIAWNIVVYTVLASTAVMRRVRADDPVASDVTPRPASRRTRSGQRSRPGYRPGFFERRFLGPALSWLLGVKQAAGDVRERARDVKAVGARFATLWWPLIRPTIRLSFRRALHLSAIGVAVGAVCGMYVRGLFFSYDVVWQSTFIKNPDAVGGLLRYVLGPASIALGYPLPTDAVAALFTAEGAPAAPWINLYAMSALLFIVVPRGVLALAASRSLRRAERVLRPDFSEEYYTELLQRARAVSPKDLEATTQAAVRDECRQVAARLAELVCDQLYDQRIAPRLWKFRDEGGTLRSLEEALRQECKAFGPVLEREMVNLERDLERRLVARVHRLLGEDRTVMARPSSDLAAHVSEASSRAATHVGERVGGDVAAVVGGVVSGAVGVVVGTVSGGFGEALGIALLVGIVETGPVGWIIGAMGGLVLAGVALVAGRDRLRQSVKMVPLPAAALKVALWTGRYERLIAEGRKKCHQSVVESLAVQLDQLAVQIADHVWTGLRPLIGELQRPRMEHEEDVD